MKNKKEYMKIYQKEWALKNRERLRKYYKEWTLKNKAHLDKYREEYYLKNKEHKRQYGFKYRSKNKEQIQEIQRKYYKKNKEKYYIYNKKYVLKNKEKVKKRRKEYVLKNKEHIQEYYLKNKERIAKQKKEYTLRPDKRELLKRAWRKGMRKRLANPNTKLKHYLRTRLHDALKGKHKSKRTMELLDCTVNELWIHLEKRFYLNKETREFMTKENYGEWHVDHIIPCASFDLSDPEQQLECFHYTNLQPLWASDNISKGSKIISGDITSPKT
tara:strand:+ start:57 stop:872 length:816 start_codon:yes stop_codon:yes gene_type:complete